MVGKIGHETKWMCIPVFLIERKVRVDTTWSIQVVSSLSLSSTHGSCWGSKEHNNFRCKLQSKHKRWSSFTSEIWLLSHTCRPEDKGPRQFYFKMTHESKSTESWLGVLLNLKFAVMMYCCQTLSALSSCSIIRSWGNKYVGSYLVEGKRQLQPSSGS